MEMDPDMRAAVLQDHDLRPLHYQVMDQHDGMGFRYNPRCGDKYTVYVQRSGEVLSEVTFMGWGCAVSKASASMMCAAMQGLTVADAKRLIQQFQLIVQGEAADLDLEQHWELQAFEGIHRSHARQQCALLAWEAMEQALSPTT